MAERAPRRSGVTGVVVSGFLGSGKTTLVRRLLEHAQREGLRLAVVSNEFGALGIDKALLGSAEAAYVELEGGCVCCQLSSELLDTLQELRERADPDAVVIETSGVAIPSDTQINFWREPVAGWVREDVVVVVVNAEQVAEGRDLDGVFVDQVTSADLIVLNKLDLVAASELVEIERRIRDIEPEAPILRAVRAEIDPAVVLPPEPGGLPRRPGPLAAHPTPHAHDRYAWREVQVPAGDSPQELHERLHALGALRVKGFVEIGGRPWVVQGVAGRIEIEPAGEPPPPELLGRIVVVERVRDPAQRDGR